MDERIVNVLIYVENHLHEPISLQSLADIANLNLFHFHRLFKQQTGLTTKQFVDSMKMEKAIVELINTNNSVVDIALKFGYNDYETFSRRFKKYHRVAPDDLRSVLKNISKNVNQKIVVVSHHSLNEEEISDKILKKIAQENYNPLNDEEVITFIVQQKNLNNDSSDNHLQDANHQVLIKNKFLASDADTIWKKVIDKYKKANYDK